MQENQLSTKHLLGIKDLTASDIQLIFKHADEFKEVLQRPIKKVPSLRDITVANLFFEKDGVLFTPQPGHILAGITRATVLEICAQLGIEVREGTYTMQDIKAADAAFFCGTAAEVIGWQSLDEYIFPKPFSETKSFQVQQAYKQLVVKPLTN